MMPENLDGKKMRGYIKNTTYKEMVKGIEGWYYQSVSKQLNSKDNQGKEKNGSKDRDVRKRRELNERTI